MAEHTGPDLDPTTDLATQLQMLHDWAEVHAGRPGVVGHLLVELQRLATSAAHDQQRTSRGRGSIVNIAGDGSTNVINGYRC